MDYALDTNTIIHFMRGTPAVKEQREKAVHQGSRHIISPFVDYELRRGLLIKPIPSHEAAYNVICANCDMEDMPPSAWQQAAEIYRDLYNQQFTVKSRVL